MPNIANISGNLLTDSGIDLSTLPSGSGTLNYLPKWTSTTALGNSLVFDNGTNVGIGTTSPTVSRLQISSGSTVPIAALTSNSDVAQYFASGTYAGFRIIAPTNTGVPYIGLNTSSSVGTYGVGAQKAFFAYWGDNDAYASLGYGSGTHAIVFRTSNGNVIIGGGTTDAGFKLDVSGTFRSTGDATLASGGGNLNVNNFTGTAVGAIRMKVDASNYGLIVQPTTGTALTQYNWGNIVLPDGSGNSSVIEAVGTGGLLRFTSPTHQFRVGSTNALYINNSAQVGIGTTSPTYTLDVNGNVEIGGTVSAPLTSHVLINPTATSTVNFQSFRCVTINPTWNSGGFGNSTIYALEVYKNARFFDENNNVQLTIDSNNVLASTSFRVGGLQLYNDNTIYYSNNIRFANSNTVRNVMFNNGNFVLGATTDAGFKFNCNGTARIQNTLTVVLDSSISTKFTLDSTNGIFSITPNVVHNFNFAQRFVLSSSTSYASGNYGGLFDVSGAYDGGLYSKVTSASYSGIITNYGVRSEVNVTNTSLGGGTPKFYGGYFVTNAGVTNTGTGLSGTQVYGVYASSTNTTSVYNTPSYGVYSEAYNAAYPASAYSFYGAAGTLYNAGAVGLGTTSPNASALLDVSSTTKGVLLPRMSGAQAEAIATPADGLVVYVNSGDGVTITSTGFWGRDAGAWVKLS